MPIVPNKVKPNMKSTQRKTSELLMCHCGCHCNLVTKATENVADAYHPKEPPYQICTQYCFKTKELLRFQYGCHGNKVSG